MMAAKGQPQSTGGDDADRGAFFKHGQPLQSGNVWRVKVERVASAIVGFATEAYAPKRNWETRKNTARVALGTGSTYINRDISLDGERHHHLDRLAPHIPKTTPFEVALRCEAVANVLQIQFNDDGVWHDFAPGADRMGVKEGPLFPFLFLCPDGLVNHRVDRPRATKSAGFKQPAKQPPPPPPPPAAAAVGTGAAEGAGSAAAFSEEL
jgi:hypothetical protein